MAANRVPAARDAQPRVYVEAYRDNALDNRVNDAYMALADVLRFVAIASGIAFFVCSLHIAPIYFAGEILSIIFWMAGDEVEGGHQPEAPPPPPFIPHQPVGIPNHNNNCCTNAIFQLLLTSNEINRMLDRNQDHPLAQLRGRYRAAQQRESHVANIQTQAMLPRDMGYAAAADAATVFDHVVQETLNRKPVEMKPFNSPETFCQQIPQDQQEELFVSLNAARIQYNEMYHASRPVPLAFERGGHRYNAVAFVQHTNHVQGHYLAYVKHPDDQSWWQADDRRTKQLQREPADALSRASLVLYRRNEN